MEITISSSAPTFRAQKAFIIYSDGAAGRRAFVTSHPIVETEKGPILAEGVRATEDAVRDVIKSLAETIVNPLCLLDPHILAASDEVTIWWVPSGHRRIAFDTKEIGKRAAITPQPALLFAVTRKGWFVHALKTDERPTAKTKLYVAPYFNVWSQGKICTGSTVMPQTAANMDPNVWTTAFFASAFTHPNIHGKNQLLKHEFGPFAFWRDMLDGEHDTFPDVLVEFRNGSSKKAVTLGDYLDLHARGAL
ncbi:PRTRC system protein B [Noviherbaspirillum galbum]|uniref:PRTRC system protein B n=1 Tax=Noviherbaspirillum galbum TaxID=2709383 RepID=A0A6B3SHH5_9BURK|nr:PRTRC system protein B [Noviherbaspirillum galbum]NEX60110.1 PRTRC system protein B [Noviherbaspirillum galbum]